MRKVAGRYSVDLNMTPSIKTMRLCPLCQAELSQHLKNARDYITGEHFDILRCEACGLGCTSPPPQNLEPYYRDYHGNRHGKSAEFRAKRRVAFVSKNTGPGDGRKLLDFGCGDGTFLLHARERGWLVSGTEMNPEIARSRGLDVVTGLKEAASHAPFHCVTLWHCLEHLPDPVGTLSRIRDLLVPDGWLIVAVPNAGGWQASWFGRDWLALDVPRHVFHYDPGSLQKLLKQRRFLPVGEAHQEFEYDILGCSQSVLNKLLPTQNLFFRLLTGKDTKAGRGERIVSWIAGMGLSCAAVPAVLAGTLFKRGGTLIVSARRTEGSVESS